MSDLGGILPIAGILAFVLWLFVLRDIASGVFLRLWHERGEEKQVDLFTVRLCWFLLVFGTFAVGAVVYLVWEMAWKIIWKRSPPSGSGRQGAPADAGTSGGTDGLHTGVRQILVWGGCCFFILAFLLASGGVSAFPVAFMLPLLAVIFSLAGLMGAPSSFRLYHPVCGGFFLPLVRSRLSVPDGIAKEERRQKLAAMCAQVPDVFPFGKVHGMLARVVLLLMLYPLVAKMLEGMAEAAELLAPLGGLVPDWLADNLLFWMWGFVVFKFLIWDAVAAWALYRVMWKEGESLACQ